MFFFCFSRDHYCFKESTPKGKNTTKDKIKIHKVKVVTEVASGSERGLTATVVYNNTDVIFCGIPAAFVSAYTMPFRCGLLGRSGCRNFAGRFILDTYVTVSCAFATFSL